MTPESILTSPLHAQSMPAGSYPRLAKRVALAHSSAVRDLLAHARQPGMISFAGGLPSADGFDTQAVSQAFAEVLANGRDSLQYGVSEGEPALREQLVALMASRAVQVGEGALIVTTGSQQGIDLVARLLLDPGDEVIVENPSYLAALSVFKLAQARLLTVASDSHGMCVAQLDKVLGAGHQPRLLYVVPDFANPTGACLSLDRRHALLKWAVKNRVAILEDNPYGELHFASAGQSALPSLLSLTGEFVAARPWVFHLSSLSKIVAPALRIGWLVVPDDVRGQAVIIKQNLDLHTSTVCQLAAARYLASGRLAQQLVMVREMYWARKQAMMQALTASFGARLCFNDPAGGMFLWARVSSEDVSSEAAADPPGDAIGIAVGRNELRDTSQWLRHALDNKVMFVPGAPFFSAAPDASTLRLSYATSTPAQIEQGVVRLKRAFVAWGR